MQPDRAEAVLTAPPASLPLRLLPYTTASLALGMLAQLALIALAIVTSPSPLPDDATGRTVVTLFLVVESLVEAFAVMAPAAAMVILAIVAARRRSRAAYWWLVGILATVVVCIAGATGASALIPQPDTPSDNTTVPDPLWMAVLGTASVFLTAVGLVGSVVLLALPATRGSLKPRHSGAAVMQTR